MTKAANGCPAPPRLSGAAATARACRMITSALSVLGHGAGPAGSEFARRSGAARSVIARCGGRPGRWAGPCRIATSGRSRAQVHDPADFRRGGLRLGLNLCGGAAITARRSPGSCCAVACGHAASMPARADAGAVLARHVRVQLGPVLGVRRSGQPGKFGRVRVAGDDRLAGKLRQLAAVRKLCASFSARSCVSMIVRILRSVGVSLIVPLRLAARGARASLAATVSLRLYFSRSAAAPDTTPSPTRARVCGPFESAGQRPLNGPGVRPASVA